MWRHSTKTSSKNAQMGTPRSILPENDKLKSNQLDYCSLFPNFYIHINHIPRRIAEAELHEFYDRALEVLSREDEDEEPPELVDVFDLDGDG